MNIVDQDISDELLNAFLDEQLDTDERSRVLNAARADQSLAKRVCELRHIKELTQHAYCTEAPPSKRPEKGASRHTLMFRALAASVILTLGILLGWFANDEFRPPSHYSGIVSSDGGGTVNLIQQAVKNKHIILHLSSGDPKKVKEALDAAEDLLAAYQGSTDKVKLEIVANSDGLNLLRADVSPYADRVRRLAERYDNLTFMACNRAIQRLQDKGIQVKLLPKTKIAPSALQQIIKRLKDGWVYVKV